MNVDTIKPKKKISLRDKIWIYLDRFYLVDHIIKFFYYNRRTSLLLEVNIFPYFISLKDAFVYFNKDREYKKEKCVYVINGLSLGLPFLIKFNLRWGI